MTAVRVVVTGVGLATSLGDGVTSTLSRLFAGERGFGELTLFSTAGYASHVAAETTWLDAGGRSRSDALAVRAAGEALARAGVDPHRERVELVLASSVAGMFETEEPLTRVFLGQSVDLDLAALRMHPTTAPADAIVAAHGPFTTARTVCSACSSGALAIGLAMDRLRRGDADVVLAGGVDALARLTLTGFSALASLDPSPCRPFDLDRRGLTLGEGAAMLVLERADRAKGRGARVIAEALGFAAACEAHHVTQPEPGGATAERVMRAALAAAGLAPGDLSHVSAHGTGTPRNDAMEAEALSRLLGGRKVPVSSVKAQLGHTLAAAGAVSAAVATEAIAQGRIPPAAGVSTLDPALAITLASSRGESSSVRAVLVDAFGFGGNDASLVLGAESFGAPRPLADVGAIAITAVSTLGPLGRSADARDYADDAVCADVARGGDDPSAWLPLDLVRRADRTGRDALALALALGRADLDELGVVVGSAFPASEASAAFWARVLEKGPRLAPPLAFPSLVPSSAASLTSIALGARGPSLAVCDLGATPIAVVATAIDLLRGGHARAMLAIAVEPPSAIVERVLGAACSRVLDGPRGAGGAALCLEPASRASRPMAIVELVSVSPTAVEVRPPRGRAAAFLVDLADCPVAFAAGWGAVPRRVVRPRTGWHEAAAGFALAAAATSIARGDVDEALVAVAAPGRAALCLLVRP